MEHQPSGWQGVRDKHRGSFWQHAGLGRWPWVVGAVGLLALVVIHGTLTRTALENDLASRARAVLDGAGADAVTVEFAGRDGTLRGDPPAGVSEEVLATRVRALAGVRVVSFGDAEKPAAEASANSQSDAEAPAPAAITAAARSNRAHSETGRQGNQVTLSGVVPSPQAVEQLVAAAQEAFGATNVVNQLTVDPGRVGSGLAPFQDLLPAMNDALSQGGSATAAMAAGNLTLTGRLPQGVSTQDILLAASDVIAASGGQLADGLTAGATPLPGQ